MSLQTDRIFIAALQADTELMETIGGRLYSTAIPLPDEDADNVPVPYVIITFDSLENDPSTKDSYEGETDRVQVSIIVVAEDRGQLAEIASQVRETVLCFFENSAQLTMAEDPDEESLLDLVPLDYQFTASTIQYDGDKPAFYQTLSYMCDTKR